MSIEDIKARIKELNTELKALRVELREATKDCCPQGHPRTPENTGTKRDGQRFCRECHKAWDRRRRQEPERKEANREYTRKWLKANPNYWREYRAKRKTRLIDKQGEEPDDDI